MTQEEMMIKFPILVKDEIAQLSGAIIAFSIAHDVPVSDVKDIALLSVSEFTDFMEKEHGAELRKFGEKALKVAEAVRQVMDDEK